MKISIIQRNEKIPFQRRVTKTETESCADWKNCDDCEKLSLQEGSSHKSTVQISKFFREIMQDKSNIVL